MLTLRDVTIRFGDRTAVDRVSLEVQDGEQLSILGPSGSGKSTLLRAIAGLEPLAEGRIEWDGQDISSVAAHRRGFGLMFQDYVLFPHLDVARNVGFGLQEGAAATDTTRERRRRVAEVLELVGLGGFEERMPFQLSGGEQQRVALARALAPRPRLLMLDEPLGALDRSQRRALLDELIDIFEKLTMPLLYVTHDHEEALAVADRVAVMRAGRIEQVGRPQEIYGQPRTGFVADFIGIANIMACRVLSAADGTVEWQGRRLRAMVDGFADGAEVLMSVRPEKLAIVADGAADGRNRLHGTVDVPTFLGPVVRLEVSVDGRPFWIDIPQAQAAIVDRKTRVTLAWSPADAVVIAAGTGGVDA